MFVWHHHSLPITQYFSHYLWAPYLSPGAVFLFLFLFFFLSTPKLTEPSKIKKKHPEHEDWTSERRRNLEQTEPVKEEEKKKKKKKKKKKTE